MEECFSTAYLPLYLLGKNLRSRSWDTLQTVERARSFLQRRIIHNLLKTLVATLLDKNDGMFLSFQTASMLALVLSCSFLFPSLDIWKKASTP